MSVAGKRTHKESKASSLFSSPSPSPSPSLLDAFHMGKVQGTLFSINRGREEDEDDVGSKPEKAYKVDPTLSPERIERENKKSNPNIPHPPSWAFGNYSSLPREEIHRVWPEGLHAVPSAAQEIIILDDLLFVMTGIDGKYIRHSHTESPKNENSNFYFDICPNIDSTFHILVEQILPISYFYLNVKKFVHSQEQFESGLVSHALCGAIRSLLKDYLILVAQLDSQLRENKLTLQKLWFYIQNEKKKMELLHHITSQATLTRASGGSLLNLLHDTSSKFASAHLGTEKLMLLFMQHAAAPYLEMLGNWIFKGKVIDYYGEFMIEEHPDQQKENLNRACWEQKYTLRENQVPIFLEKMKDKILTIGKYLNILAQCGIEVKFPEKEETSMIFTHNFSDCAEKIEKMYDLANRRLFDLLCNGLDLWNRIRSMKRFFLLDQGDFFIHFMDFASDELQKPTREISKGKLKTLLEWSLQASSLSDTDEYKDDLGLEFHPYTLLDMLLSIIQVTRGSSNVNQSVPLSDSIKGKELFTFSYDVKWPLSLVITTNMLIKYQLIFRQLSFCKNVEHQLLREWSAKYAQGYGPAYALRHIMLHFLQNFQFYMMTEVIEPNWRRFEEAFRKVSTVDEVIKIHSNFLDSCLCECMLTDPDLVKILMKLLTVCESFAELIMKPIFVGTVQTTINNTEKDFKDNLFSLFNTLKHLYSLGGANNYMIHLLTRLDYNGFYSQSYPPQKETQQKN